jgi:hypothetical protein
MYSYANFLANYTDSHWFSYRIKQSGTSHTNTVTYLARCLLSIYHFNVGLPNLYEQG